MCVCVCVCVCVYVCVCARAAVPEVTVEKKRTNAQFIVIIVTVQGGSGK